MQVAGTKSKNVKRKRRNAMGETLTSVFRDGKVLFSSGEWDAVSQTLIASGRRVRVVRMLLEVEEEFSTVHRDELTIFFNANSTNERISRMKMKKIRDIRLFASFALKNVR